MKRSPANFREYAGVLVAFIVVLAFVAIGYIQVAIVLYRGVAITIPGDWMAAMLSLASTALGFLIGKQLSGAPTPPADPQ